MKLLGKNDARMGFKTEDMSPWVRFVTELSGLKFFAKGSRVYKYELFWGGFTDTTKLQNNEYKGITSLRKTAADYGLD